MLYLRKCLVALMTPWGRLPPVTFAALAMLLIGVHCTIQLYVTSMGEDLPPYNAWSMSLFFVMWSGFCLTSRRFHDSGKTAFYLVPLLIVTFASYLAVLDDMHLATSVFEEDRNMLRWAERVRFALQIVGMMAMVAALIRPGDEAPNAFGSIFYDPKANAKRAKRTPHASADRAKPKAADRIAAVAHAPTATRHSVAAAVVDEGDAMPTTPHPRRRADDRPGPGPRGRITPSELVRHRGEGFGRR